MTDSIRHSIIDALDTRFKTIKDTDQVIGSDTKNYICKLAHTAASSNKPITGADWATYWTQTGSAGIAWVTGSAYTAGGYKTDLGNNIFAWRDLEKNPFQISELPALNYKDVMVEHEPLCFGSTLDTMPVECEIGVSGSNSESTLRDCISDIEKMIGTALSVSEFLDMELKSDEMDIEHLENKIMIAKVILQIQYLNTNGNPDA